MALETLSFGAEITCRDHCAPILTTSDLTAHGYKNRIYELDQATVNVGATTAKTLLANELKLGDLVFFPGDVAGQDEVVAVTVIGTTFSFVSALKYTHTKSVHPNINAGSLFRWLQNPITGLDTSWVAGVLAKVGIGAWKQSINLERGGNIADPSEGSLSVVNTDKFWSLLFSNNINLSGCLCRIYEFSDTTGTIRAILNCLPTDSWDTATYNIPLQKASQKMLAAISAYTAPTVLPDGSNTSPFMPAIFGKLSHAKAILKNIDLSLFQNEQDGLFTVWPVSAKGRTTFYWGYQDFIGTYVIYIADYLTMNVSLGTVKAYFEGKAWVLFLTGSAKGVYRKIKTVVEVAENTGYIHVLFEQAFPAGNTPNGSAWCEIYLGDLENVLDTWPCLGSMSEDLSTPMLSNYPAFLYNNNAYSNITGQIISSFIDSGKNSFRPDLSTATNDYKTFTKTDIIPLMNLRLCPEFLEWGFPLVAHGGDTWSQMKSIKSKTWPSRNWKGVSFPAN